MNKPLKCRAEYCSSIYYTENDLKKHESLVHRNMIENAAIKLVNTIIATNPGKADEKVFMVPNIGKCSYNEMKEKVLQDTPEGKAIKQTLMNFVNLLLADGKKISDLWTMEYRIGDEKG